MAETKEPTAHVRYRVLQRCFVNGVLVDPADANLPLGAERGRDGRVYVMAPPGLEGKALHNPKGKPSAPADEQKQGEGSS